MRNVLALCVVAASACVRPIPLSPVEQCATQGMVLEGVSFSSGQSVGTGYNSSGGWAVANGAAYGQSTQCRRPTSQAEQCQIVAAYTSAQFKANYAPIARNVFIGAGYLVFLIPGVVLYLVFDAEQNGIVTDANTAGNKAGSKCWSDSQVKADHVEVHDDGWTDAGSGE